MTVKNKRRLELTKKLVIPKQPNRSLRLQYQVIKKDVLQLGRDVARGYEILKDQIGKQMNRKLLIRARANK